MRKSKELARRLFELEGKVMNLNTLLKASFLDLSGRAACLEVRVRPPSGYRHTYASSKNVDLYSLPDQIVELRNQFKSLEARVEQLADIHQSLIQGGPR